MASGLVALGLNWTDMEQMFHPLKDCDFVMDRLLYGQAL